MNETKSANEIKLTRLYNAPVQAVWDAWTQDDQVGQWWGPRGYTITNHHKELRAGGLWHYTMHGPDGTDYVNKSQYLEFIPYSKMVYDHGGNDEQKPMFRVTVLFSEAHGKTQMEMTMALPSPEAAENTGNSSKKPTAIRPGTDWPNTWKRKRPKKKFLSSTADFQAPLETLFQAWTDPEHLSRWVPPPGFTMKYLKADIRPGGKVFTPSPTRPVSTACTASPGTWRSPLRTASSISSNSAMRKVTRSATPCPRPGPSPC